MGVEGTFLQSFEWGELQKESGRKIWRLEGNDWQALVVGHSLPFGMSYLYCPGGPTIKKDYVSLGEDFTKAFAEFLRAVKHIAADERATFLKVEPLLEMPSLKNVLGLRSGRRSIQPQKTAVVNLAKSTESLLADMHQKTRYNIGLARKHGISVEVAENNEENSEIFWDLLAVTGKRDGFAPHPKEYYQNILRVFSAPESPNPVLPRSELLFAEHEGNVLAAAILMSFGGRTYYLHGASSREQQALMAPHLLHWEAIFHAKAAGSKEYDFWGIDEKRWAGLTRFKLGFGGRVVEYVGSFDAVYKPVLYAGYLFRQRILRPF